MEFIYKFCCMPNLWFLEPLNGTSHFFSLILLMLTVHDWISKRAKFYYDQLSIRRIMRAQTCLKMSIFWFFELIPYVNLYPDYIFYKRKFLCSLLHVPIPLQDIWNIPRVEVVWFEPHLDHRFCCFWAILLLFQCDYLDNWKR